MKLQRKQKTAPRIENWHPSFRFEDRLPDLKVVRTSFFVNMLFVTLALAAALLTTFREYTTASLETDIAQAESRVAELGAKNGKLLAMNKDFSLAVRKFTEIENFRAAPFVPSELLVALGRTVPEFVDFTSISYDKGQLLLRGSIRGASDTASSRLTAYLDALRADADVGGAFPDISLTSLLRDPRTQGLSFEIQLKQTAENKAKNARA
ncbi:MAG: hypothetical protein ACREIA_24365 [Opitutaceae bacterium]